MLLAIAKQLESADSWGGGWILCKGRGDQDILGNALGAFAIRMSLHLRCLAVSTANNRV